MPNLDHDPQNPTDLMGRPIKPGDVVAWGTTYGRSAALAVCVIEKIRFITKENGESWGKNIEVEQWQATDYQLILRPIKSTGSVDDKEYVPDGFVDPDTGETRYFRKRDKAKTKTVQLVKNVVKLEPLA
jgi:hypothetical protein